MRAVPLCLLLVLSCAAPKRDYTPDQIMKEADFNTLMHVQATVADPRFALAKGLDAEAVTENHFEQFLDMGRRLQLTSGRIATIAKSDFDGLNKQLAGHAKELEAAALALDGVKTLKSVRAIKKTCSACHAQFR